jgi:ubiquinone/menaquinone biosynthesis C-methylase UbiE
MYESSADDYSKMMDKEIELPVYRDVLGRLHRDISDIPGTLLDTACGSGHILDLFNSEYDSERSIIGIDISPRMVAIAKKRLGKNALVLVGDMRVIPVIEKDTVAAVMNFFAIHHLDTDGIREAMLEWYRVLVVHGRLLIAAWEGNGNIDYGEESDIVALRYRSKELIEISEKAGFRIARCKVDPVEGFPMDAIYLECKKE